MEATLTVGVDEAGYGTLWGPISVAATCSISDWRNPCIRDSKKMSPKIRNEAIDQIKSHMLWSHAFIPASVINESGMVFALNTARRRVVEHICKTILERYTKPHITVVVDGNDLDEMDLKLKSGLVVHILPMVRGDSHCFECSAASVIAKVTRDRFVHEHVSNEREDIFGLRRNKGYGTEDHRRAIMHRGLGNLDPEHRLGACESLVRNYLKKKARHESPAAPV